MNYLILANITLALHFLFILFVVFGGLLVLYKRWIIWLHIPAAVYGILIEFSGLICPLTYFENKFRVLAGQSGYTDSFIEQYLTRIIYPENLTRQDQIILGIILLVFNFFAYILIFKRFKKKQSQ